jgi:hypothetical protein
MIQVLVLLLSLLLSFEAQAATLAWDAQTIVSPLTVERSATQTGTFATVATLPAGSTEFVLTPGAYGWYRVRNSAGPSNVVQFSLDLYSGSVTTRLDTLESSVSALAARLVALESAPAPAPSPTPTPAPTSNFTITQIDADHVRLVCNGIGITTSGSGTSRTLECRH